MAPRLPQLREDVANAITFHPGNRTGTPEQRHPVSLMLADAVLRVVRPCTCDGDPIECSHEAARGQAEEENRQLRAERDAEKAELAEARAAISRGKTLANKAMLLAGIGRDYVDASSLLGALDTPAQTTTEETTDG